MVAFNHVHVIRLSKRPPLFELILIKDVSRYTRDILAIEAIRKLREKNVFVNFTTINKSTKDTTGDFMISLLTLFAEEESRIGAGRRFLARKLVLIKAGSTRLILFMAISTLKKQFLMIR